MFVFCTHTYTRAHVCLNLIQLESKPSFVQNPIKSSLSQPSSASTFPINGASRRSLIDDTLRSVTPQPQNISDKHQIRSCQRRVAGKPFSLPGQNLFCAKKKKKQKAERNKPFCLKCHLSGGFDWHRLQRIRFQAAHFPARRTRQIWLTSEA